MKFPFSGVQVLCAATLLGAGALLSGCASIANGVAVVGETAGVITPQQGDSLRKVGDAVEKTFADITPEQEYYLGRAVGATIVHKFKVYDNEVATRYINVLGQTLAAASERPETFGGWHFLILDSDEINAFAAPGGFVFVSRGMLRLCKTEDDLAAVLAHEVGHVELQHALRAIKGSRLTSALTTLALESAKSLGGEALAQVTEAFEGSITDISGTLMNSGYARKQERQSDEVAIRVLKSVGYDPYALTRVLTEMQKHLEPGGHDFAATHPPPQDRVKDLKTMLGKTPAVEIPAVRTARFQKALAGI
ncbi:MAG: M48 family metalloprotease [Kiritimatiellae bacterium]|nr:M48 family metalloprotease [Kiritimatiellia bacterium]MCO5068067.1 M48 family metallopeptidase [Kiritimatiellia bacterium]